METLGARIKRLRDKAGLTQDGLARRVDVSKNTVLNWEKDRREPRSSEVEAIAAALCVPVSELLPTSETSILVSGAARTTTDAEVNATASDEIPVPLYRMAPGDDTPKPIRTMIFRRSVLGDSPAEAYIGIEMRDTSMEPRIPDGSVVVIDTTQTEPRRGGMYYVRFKKDGKCERDAVRFVYPAKDGGYELKSAEGSGIPPD
ncbi:MAG: LexA family transcriptional regulator, partial [Synergistales bacterium]|nr:LexA family transcriptional regulator [Synergistales bacterium]